ncbi:MAG: HEPN domain-containing protein [Nanoarchaeota archaeon]
MEIKSIKDCIKLRLLRKIAPSQEKSIKSLELSKKNLKEIEYFLDEKKEIFLKFAIESSYTSMFHAARAVLYKDGIQEKNHFAIFIYLKEKYSGIVPFSILNLLNIHRLERHSAIYGLEYKPTLDDAKEALDDAKRFIGEIEKLLKR